MSVNFSTERKPLINYSLAGLADIVLLLLVFFLLTSSFIPQFGIQVNLPKTETSAPTPNQSISVAITKDGTFYVDQQRVPREALLQTIRGKITNQTSMVVRADQDAKWGDVTTVASIATALNLRVLGATDRTRK